MKIIKKTFETEKEAREYAKKCVDIQPIDPNRIKLFRTNDLENYDGTKPKEGKWQVRITLILDEPFFSPYVEVIKQDN